MNSYIDPTSRTVTDGPARPPARLHARSFLENELSTVQTELREAREDLERDEIIFADKMKELQVCVYGCGWVVSFMY